MHTTEILALELEKIGLDEMAESARNGLYHDFLSPLDMPCIQLVTNLQKAGTPAALALRQRAINGEFDATKEESDEWARSPDGQATFAKLHRR